MTHDMDHRVFGNQRSPFKALVMTTSFAFLFPALAGCSSSSTAASADAGSAAFKHDIMLHMELTVPAGAELHQCQYATLSNTTDVDAIAFAHQYTLGSHHFLVIQTDLDTIPPDMTGQYDCTNGDEPIMQHSRGVLYGAQTPTGNFPLPRGVGFHFTAKQVVILQTHYLNAGAAPIDASIDFGIDVAAPGTITTQAGYMFFYDPFVYAPAHGMGSTGIACKVPSDITVVSAQTHYHQRATGMKVFDDAAPTPAASPFFETHDWEHPTPFVGPLAVSAGSDLRFQCDYMNTDANDVFEGPNAKTSEMCVFGGLYYPKLDSNFENCEDMSFYGGGQKSCSDLTTCVQACPSSEGVTGPCWQKCVASGCAGATDKLLPLVGCVQQNCATECGAGQCAACAASKCGDPYIACTQATCQ